MADKYPNPYELLDRKLNTIQEMLSDINVSILLNKDVRKNQSILSRKEAKEYLGISFPTLWKLTTSGQLPHTYIGDSPKYKLEDLDNFIEKNKK